ncbi:hypothetical protein SH528x_001084 [Novipirellula sp. SH528]|uniref:hypothetical protein n=1 Tax=Novipirellula sp. SH528 TaxID=3454466 RepID=UPI003F9F90B1
MRSSFQHTIYCFHGRRRWRFLCFDTDSATPDQQLLNFAATIARHTNAKFLGYNAPERLLVA